MATPEATDQTQSYAFKINKPKLRKHTKSRKGCLACKSRKVKCSETLPTCAHCARLGIDCVYSRAQTALPTPPRDSIQHNLPFTLDDGLAQTPVSLDDRLTESPFSLNNSLIAVVKGPSKAFSLSDCIVPATTETHEQMSIIESLHFFNTCLLPEVAPAHAPFQRTLISATRWLSAPRVIQLALLILTKAIKKSRSSPEPFFDQEILHFRGICLAELTTLLPESHSDYSGLTFDSIQLVMLAEMQLEPNGSWAYHLEATRRLVVLKGGLGSVFYKKPELRYSLINYMGIDIMTTTTCPVSVLDTKNVDSQSSYIPLLAHREEETITTASFCPLNLMQCIVDINKLRLRCSRQTNSWDDCSARIQEHTRIHDSISAFNPSSWASRILDWNSILPRPASEVPSKQDNAAMAILAQTHQEATLLYLYLSCPLLSSAVETLTSQNLLSVTHHSLTSNLAMLLSQRSADTEGPLHGQLHKFAIWPLIVAAYASAGWGPWSSAWSETYGGELAEQDLDRVRLAAKVIGSRPLMVAATVLEGVKARRKVRLRSDRWRWDEAWESRGSYCVL